MCGGGGGERERERVTGATNKRTAEGEQRKEEEGEEGRNTVGRGAGGGGGGGGRGNHAYTRIYTDALTRAHWRQSETCGVVDSHTARLAFQEYRPVSLQWIKPSLFLLFYGTLCSYSATA